MALTADKNTRISTITVHDIDIELASKRIKNIYLRVCSPQGNVKISAPLGMPLTSIEGFVRAKQGWIKKQQQKIVLQQRQHAALKHAEEGCYFQGLRYGLQVESAGAGKSEVVLSPLAREIVVQLGRNMPVQKALEQWYRQQLQAVLPPLMERWQEKLNVCCTHVQVRTMRTRWGSCTPATGSIRINLELIKRAPACLEYVVVHELLHLLQAQHNRHFYALLDQYLPDWRKRRSQLNAVPLTDLS